MRSRKLTTALAVTIMVLGATLVPKAGESDAVRHAELDKPAPDFTLNDIGGEKRSLSDYQGKYVVLEWNNWDCPFVKKHYGGNMQRLQKHYADKGVVWLTICSSGPGKQGYYDADAHRERLKKSGSAAAAYLVDADGKVGRTYGAKTTPHMFVIDPQGVLIYAGAIDDKPSTRESDVEGATNYVQACLDAAMAGEEITVKSSAPYGCSVKYQ